MDTALAGGVLSVALAEGAITISAGQARLGNTMVRAQGADLAVAGGVNLSEGVLDVRLTFSGLAGASASGDGRPEILIALKGPVNAPKRTLDVAVLSSWLALRAVEQQSKKLDMLEGQSRKLDMLEGGEPPPPPASPQSVPPPAADVPTGSAPIQNVPAAAAPAAPATVLVEPEPPLTRPALPVPPKPKPAAPTAEQVAPPIDIRPAPAPRPPRQPGAAGLQGATRQAPPPPVAPRSLSEILFGR
jgi:large subunit ribosomal protein L24